MQPMFRMPVVNTFTFYNPTISITTNGMRFANKCDEREVFVPKSRILSVERADNEILIFLTENQIVQLIDCPKEAYGLIIDTL